MIVELHFQEGFSGHTVEVRVGSRIEASFEAKTRYQINLAHVLELELRPGRRVDIRLPETGERIELPTRELSRYYLISRGREGGLTVQATEELPKYM